MAWKVYNIHSGRIIKAGFDDEELAKDWMESRRDLSPEDYLVEEMDSEEEDLLNEDEDEDLDVDSEDEEVEADDTDVDYGGGDDDSDVYDEDDEEDEDSDDE